MATKYKKPLKKTMGNKIVCQNKDCASMGKHLNPDEFYKSRNPMVKHHPFCKNCVNNMIDIDNTDTICDVLKVLDIPFVMKEWLDVKRRYSKNYLSEYLKVMNVTKRKLYGNLRYKDSIFELEENPEPEVVVENAEPIEASEVVEETPVWDDEWQGYYTKSDLAYLNNYYQGLNNDFKIITTNHRDYARKIAQASLSQMKAFQKFQAGEEGADVAYEKATKLFDMLSKSAQFAESQRGANDVSLGCFGRVFDAVEKHNWVPELTPTDEDMYDKLLKQFSNIERSL